MTEAAPPADDKTKRPSRLRRIARRLLRIIIAVYLGICLVMYFAQNWLVFPGIIEQGSASTVIRYGGSAEVLHLATSTGVPIAAVFGGALNDDDQPVADTANCPTIIYFYGNGDSVAYSQGVFDHMRKLGANVLIADMAGFGASGGKASEVNFYATADAGWDYLMHRTGIDRTRIVAVGWSMGAAVAIDLAHRKPVAGLAVYNAFTDLPSMARRLFPWLPTSLLLKYRFDNLSKIRDIHCPILICNGLLDTLIAPDMSDQLAAAAGRSVTRQRVVTADHNSIFVAEPKTVWPALKIFIAGK